MKKMKRVREKAAFGNFRGRRKEKMPKRKKNEKGSRKSSFGNSLGQF